MDAARHRRDGRPPIPSLARLIAVMIVALAAMAALAWAIVSVPYLLVQSAELTAERTGAFSRKRRAAGGCEHTVR